MTIFVAVFLNIYVTLLRFMYNTRDCFAIKKAEWEQKQASEMRPTVQT
jgi:hypothetical protein